jgi:hypothetical protein
MFNACERRRKIWMRMSACLLAKKERSSAAKSDANSEIRFPLALSVQEERVRTIVTHSINTC